jgi:hypothetical protein
MIACATVLSGCTRDHYYYSTGPWGPSTVYRAYPTYNLPWRGPSVGESNALFGETSLFIDGGDMDPVVRRVPVPVGHVEVLLPYDPLPHGPPVEQTGGAAGRSPSRDKNSAVQVPPVSASQASILPRSMGPVSAPTRPASYAGRWTAVDERGVTCKLQLSSTPALDLYRASSSGCANHELKGVTAWNFGNNTVTLYARGRIIAQLAGQEANLEGSLGSRGHMKMTR